jgi:putative tricarboxylic transport membrane protein
VVEVVMLVAFGFLGLQMRRWDYPVAPMIVGLILGPMAEAQLRRSLQLSLGDPMIFLENPGSATLLVLSALALLAPFLLRGLNRFKAGED